MKTINLFLIGEIECIDCHIIGTIKIPTKLDSRHTVVAQMDWLDLPEGWTQHPNDYSSHYYSSWEIYGEGYRCGTCSGA
jgi:hypothetical protein